MDFELLEGWSNYNAADFTFTKRFSHRWQGTATYTLSQFKDSDPRRDQWYIGSDGLIARRPIGFALAPDMGGEYTTRVPTQVGASAPPAINVTAPSSTAYGIWATGCS